MKKRIISMLLSVTLLLGLLPAQALAADTTAISTAEAFAAMEASGSYELTADITVTAPYTKGTFTGTFDGKGHTVTLAITGSDSNVGLFSEIGTGGTVKNVITEGSVSGDQYVAGIAGKSAGTIESCLNKAAISGSGSNACAGIAAAATGGTVKSCGNTGTITAGSNGRWVGGIVGDLSNTTLFDCYNQGTINTSRKNPYAGGIVGNSKAGSSIKNCYNTGTINVSADSTNNYGGILGWLVSGVTFDTCYYLDTSTSKGVAGYDLSDDLIAKAVQKTEAEMQSAEFADALGDGFLFRNGSYPVLAWQTPVASVAFTLAPANAVLTINGGSFTGSTTVSLPAGEYPYTVSCDGYTQQSGSITVTAQEAENGATLDPVSVTLVKDESLWCTTTFQLTPADATVEVKDGSTVVAPEDDGSYQLLKGHAYRYTVTHSDASYVERGKSFTPTESTETITVTLQQVESIELTGEFKTEYTQGEALDTTGMKIILHYVGTKTTQVNEVDSYVQITGFNSSQPTEKQTLTVTYYGRTTTYDIKINEKGFPSNIFNPLKGKATVEYSHNSSYKGEDGQEFVDHTDGSLKSNSADMNSSIVTITIKFADNLPASVFSFDYKVSSEGSSYNDWDGIKINGGKTICGQTEFTTYTANVKGGDSFTIAYKKDGSGKSGDDCIYLKNFQLGQLHDFVLTVQPGDAEVKLTKEGDTTAIAGTQNEGVYTYQLMEGSYAYTVSKFGYTAQTGTITIPTDSAKEITLVENAKQTVTFAVTKPEGVTGDYTLTVKHGSDVMEPTGANTYALYDGDYTYTVTHDRCETVSGEFTVNGAAVEKTVTLVRKWVIADYFENISGITAANGADYGFVLDADDTMVLASNNQGQGRSNATLTLEFDRAMALTFQYKVSSEANYDKFTIVHNEATLATESGTTALWKSCTVNVTSGDKLILTYSKDGSGNNGKDTVWLKDFTVLHKVSFTGAPEGAVITLKQGDTVLTAQEDGSYLLAAGEYSYSISAPGYKVLGDQTLTVGNADVTVPVTMEPSTFTFESVFTPVQDVLTAANDAEKPFAAFEMADGGYLQSSNKTNSSNSSITLTFTKPARLSFQYWVSESGSPFTSETKYGLVVKNGDRIAFSKTEVSTAWQTYTLDVNAGETVTISYSCYVNSNDMSPMDENFLRLRNFQATALCAVNFTGAPEGATLTVKRGEDTMQPYSGSTYLLEAGTYSYSVSAFGYTGVENQTLTVAAEESSKEVSARLTALGTKTIRFAVEPSDAAVTLTHETAGDMSAFRQDDGSYKLPENESYSYIVSKNGYVERRGSFTADGDKTITVPALVFCGEAWDGATKTEPTKNGEVYQISNAAELAWFADAVNGGQTNLSAQLTANINLGGKTWTSIGAYDKQYAGRFDGNYKMISGLVGGGGLFDYVAAEGYVGATAVNGIINGSGHVGGIADTNYGTIENCLFNGSLTVNTSGYGGSCGGIVGRSQGETSAIRGCVNMGTIHNSNTSYNQNLNTGGIVGYTYGTVENCYNRGTISAELSGSNGTLTNYGIGGIVGSANSSYATGANSIIKNVYNTGKVTGPSSSNGDPGALVGNNSGTVTNAWYLAGTAEKAAGKGTAIQNAEKTAEAMKSDRFAFELGEAFRVDSEGSNSGYPVLAWQGGSEPVISDDGDAVELAAAALVLKKADGTEIPAEDGKYPIREELSLLLDKTGEHNTTITWSASPEGYVDLETGKVSLPLSGHPEVTLTATITRGEESAQKQFTLIVWSSTAAAQKLLDQIKTEATQEGVFIQPLEVYGHSNIVDAMEQYLLRGEYNEDIVVSLVNIGTKVSPNNATKNLAEDGTITYYTDIDATENYATYQNVTFRLTLGDATVDIPMTVHIGWSEEFADDYMLNAAKSITWEMIRGENENTSTTSGGTTGDSEWWETVTVNGTVSGNLLLPLKLTSYPAVTVAWTSKTTSAMEVKDNGNGTYTGILHRPVYGQPDTDFRLTARVSFNRLDDYMKEEMTQEGGSYESNCYEVKNFDMKIAASKDDIGKEIYDALEQYPSLLRDFVDKTKTVDCDHITDDLQMPRPATLEDAGIMPDSYNEKVTMVSKTPDVLDFMGYHAVVYRPLPGSAPATATYTISIYDRPSGALLATRDFTITIDPLTQKEIDDAKAFMDMVSTGEVYWEGIKNANTSKDNVTSDLDSFVEILPDGNGGYTFVRGMANITFGGVEVDDLPGYDSMGTQNWREFRSSRESIITSETLFVTQPEYDTNVKIDSVLTHNAMAKYWTKFQGNPAYAKFEQFYKRPVSATVTVKGTKGEVNPVPVGRITVTVGIDGGNFENFRNTAGFSFSREADADWTAWDAVEAFFQANGYTYKGSGNYISAVTDPAGVELAELEHGKGSGWMYRLNGELPDELLSQYILKNGDKIELFYTGDYTTVPGAHGDSTKDEAVKKVESLIQAIGTVTEDSGDKIQAARAAYDALTDAQKKQVSNYDTLTAAEEAFKSLRGELPFTDVNEKHWAYSYIQQVYNDKLMNGVSATIFAPEETITRGMIVTMLYRLAGSPAVTGSAGFTDVSAGSYYEKAVIWASSNAIVKGVSATSFAPDENITREQLAVMLYRYAQFAGLDTNIGEETNILSYTDASSVSEYAMPAIQWACGAGLIQGRTKSTLVPQGTATRAEAATIFVRFQVPGDK